MTEQTDFSAWIGRTDESLPEELTNRLLDRYRAMLEPHLANTGHAPAGVHWCLSPPAVTAALLGEDGHPQKGGFLPPVPLPRRMWAGGELEFLDPLREGDVVTRRSRITDVRHKDGRSGALCFVTLNHEHATQRGVAIRERQDIVYRAASTAAVPAPAANARIDADLHAETPVDTVMLFRYSALTFNGHRIHYDEQYAREVEFYPGLVIHGPLQATLLLNFAASLGGGMPRKFSFRGESPACGPQTLRLRAWRNASGMELATVTSADVTAMTGTATW